jgi:hypothetical protein
MAVGLVLKFDDITHREYEAVNAQLGIDPKDGSGDWPRGLLSHAAGPVEGGGFAVIEVWESREAQNEFMEGRLGRALAAGGVTSRPEMTWIDLIAYSVHPAGAPA